MAKNNRKSAVRRAVSEDVITRERHQHGYVRRSDEQMVDADGRICRPFIARNILDAMHARGSITDEMRKAGERFRETFARAHLDGLRCADAGRIHGLGGLLNYPITVLDARDDVWRMVGRVGGLDKPAGSCLWDVLGLEMSLKDWSLSQSWNGRPCNPMVASGILVAALGTLAA